MTRPSFRYFQKHQEITVILAGMDLLFKPRDACLVASDNNEQVLGVKAESFIVVYDFDMCQPLAVS